MTLLSIQAFCRLGRGWGIGCSLVNLLPTHQPRPFVHEMKQDFFYEPSPTSMVSPWFLFAMMARFLLDLVAKAAPARALAVIGLHCVLSSGYCLQKGRTWLKFVFLSVSSLLCCVTFHTKMQQLRGPSSPLPVFKKLCECFLFLFISFQYTYISCCKKVS